VVRSIEINWLRRFDRSLVVPEIVFHLGVAHNGVGECSGFYAHPGKYELLIDGRYVDAHFGIIVVGLDKRIDIPGVLAHEWRHHWQLHNGFEWDHLKWDASRGWEAGIRKYFRSSRSEMDALTFERKVAPGLTQLYPSSFLHLETSLSLKG
jgi:hypothetical protein